MHLLQCACLLHSSQSVSASSNAAIASIEIQCPASTCTLEPPFSRTISNYQVQVQVSLEGAAANNRTSITVSLGDASHARMGLYSFLLARSRQADTTAAPPPFHLKLVLGSLSGAAGAFVGTPSEIALVRMADDSKLPPGTQRNYRHSLDCVRRIAREEGFTKLWRGATPTILRASVLNAFQLGCYSQAKEELLRRHEREKLVVMVGPWLTAGPRGPRCSVDPRAVLDRNVCGQATAGLLANPSGISANTARS